MPKSAQQRMNEYWNECDQIRAAVKNFNDRSFEANGSFSFAAGFLESTLVDAIMQLPKAKREEFRARVENARVSFQSV